MYAFYDCESLESITIPASVKSVGSYAFYNCTALKSAVFAGSMSELGIWSFAGCTALTEMQLPEGLEKLNNHVLYRCESLENLEIPDTVTAIDGYALAGCSSLTEVNVPASVEKVGEYAVGYGEGVLPVVAEDVNIVSESPAVQDFCKENEVKINGEGGVITPEQVDEITLGEYLHGKKPLTQGQFKGADMNADGVVNVFDWILLKKQLYINSDEEQPTEELQDPTGNCVPEIREGNVLAETKVRSDASAENDDNIIATLEANAAVRIIDNFGDWFMIEYKNGETGYVLQSEVAVAP